MVEEFQNGTGAGALVLSLKAGGTGLNLTAADYVFILDPWWNPAVEAQAIGRAHRMGQANKVFAYRMIAKGTVEEKITEDTEAAGRTVRASEDDPQYRVRSEKSGNDAVHKPTALDKD